MLKKRPFIVAEISANHNGNIKNAFKLIYLAKKYGADAVKLQTFEPQTMTLNIRKKLFKVNEGLWKNYYLWELYKRAQTPFSWQKRLFAYAKKNKILCFSTPFDETAVDLLEKLNCPIYKISSFEMTDIPLVRKVARTKKPIIISTGMANLKEIETTYKIAKKYGAKDITLLYCVSNYPAKNSDFNLNNIKILKKKIKCRVGLSDHSKDNKVAIAAVAIGAEVIEKHIALKNQKKGLDINFSVKGNELKKFRNDIDLAFKLKGYKNFYRNKSEKTSEAFRRSIFVVKDIKKGEKFSIKNIRRIRPGFGVSPVYYEKILGKKSPLNIKKENPLTYKVMQLLKIKKTY